MRISPGSTTHGHPSVASGPSLARRVQYPGSRANKQWQDHLGGSGEDRPGAASRGLTAIPDRRSSHQPRRLLPVFGWASPRGLPSSRSDIIAALDARRLGSCASRGGPGPGGRDAPFDRAGRPCRGSRSRRGRPSLDAAPAPPGHRPPAGRGRPAVPRPRRRDRQLQRDEPRLPRAVLAEVRRAQPEHGPRPRVLGPRRAGGGAVRLLDARPAGQGRPRQPDAARAAVVRVVEEQHVRATHRHGSSATRGASRARPTATARRRRSSRRSRP